MASQEAERHRIASELHDSLGQELLLIKNRVELALKLEPVPPELREQLVSVAETASRAIGEARRISHHLRPQQLDQLGLTRALQAMVEHAAQSTSIAFESRIEPVDDVIPPHHAIQLYRVAQEGLNNVLKHSNARHVRMLLERDIQEVRLLIEDDGGGFSGETPPLGGFGLQNIAERVQILGGTFAVSSRPGGGVSLRVVIPISPETPPPAPS